jgi:branched-chain amino acid transport system ATP-binding protein
MSALLVLDDLTKNFGGLRVTDHVSLDLRAGEVHALIGPNGAGKTTLISQVMGELAPDSGAIFLDGAELRSLSQAARVKRGLARTFQVPQVLGEYSARENVIAALYARGASADEADQHLVRAAISARADVRVSDLAHGERKQLELAIALATRPRMLLLDEPMAGLGPAESEQMISILQGLRGEMAMLLVEHDMKAVFALADRISVLVYGAIIASGTPQEIQNDPRVREAYLGTGED